MSQVTNSPDIRTLREDARVSGGLAGLTLQQEPAAGATLAERVLPYFQIARPDHWFKNVFMLAGVLLAYFCYPELLGVDTIATLCLGLVATCLLASSNYVINEILDAPTDRSHPVKRYRPIPAGRVHLGIAYAEWLLLAAAGLLIAQTINWAFFASGAFLLFMGLIYNVPPVRSKELPYIDVLSESINNPIRLLLGWFVVTSAFVRPMSLIVAYWMIGAFFMATKRLAEYRSLANRAVAGAYRRSFQHYNEEKLLISMFFYTTCFALFLGVFIIRYHLELILIFPLVAGFVCYYLYVAFKKDSAAQSPERLYREKGLMAYLVICFVAFFLLMFTDIPVLYDWFNVRQSPVPALWRF